MLILVEIRYGYIISLISKSNYILNFLSISVKKILTEAII